MSVHPVRYQDNQKDSLIFPSPLKLRHINDLFDKHSIYEIFKNLSLQKFRCGRDFHCFYFGINDILRIPRGFTIRHFQNRNISLEEILHTATIVFDLTGISLTYVSLRKNNLLTKETVKSLYLNPTDSNLWPVNFTQINKTDQMGELIGFAFRGIKSEMSSFVLDCSFNDDLEELLESVRNNGGKISPDSKHIFFTSLLTQNEMLKLESKDDDFIKSFHNSNYNIPTEMMSRTNSKSRYDFWSGFRTSINIPSEDYPFIDESGFSILDHYPVWINPYLKLEVEFDTTTKSSIENIDPDVYCQNYNAKQNFLLDKKGGKPQVFLDEEYVNAYDYEGFFYPRY